MDIANNNRDPSALESLSSVLTGVSSYVANTLPTSFSMPTRGFTSPSSPAFPGNPSSPYYYPAAQGSSNPLLGGNQDSVCVLTNGDVILFSAFDWIEAGPMAKNRTSRYALMTHILLGGEGGGEKERQREQGGEEE